MKANSTVRQNFRNQINRTYRNAKASMRHVPLAMLMGVVTFGYVAFGFLRNLVTVSDGPFARLTTKQLMQMSWLYCLYR